MKAFKIIGGILSIIGIAVLIGFIFSIMNTRKFLADSIVSEGEVIDIAVRTSTDSDGNTTRSRYPVIRFRDHNGNEIEFESSSSVSGGIMAGQAVPIRYLPENPRKAKMDSFSNIWGFSIFFLVFGVVFTGVGVPFFWLGIRDRVREKKALTYAKEIRVPIKEVILNESITVNGRSPYQITAQWLNPDTNELHIFKSKNLWYDPSDFLQDEVTVKADPHNYKKYWMDISFLPKKA